MALRSLAVLGLHFREEQVHGSRLLQKKRRQVRIFYWNSDACVLGETFHSQVYQIAPGFRYGHEQGRQIPAFCLAALTPVFAVSSTGNT